MIPFGEELSLKGNPVSGAEKSRSRSQAASPPWHSGVGECEQHMVINIPAALGCLGGTEGETHR